LFEIKGAAQGISLWYFHMYTYYNTNWFISSILSPWFMVVSAGSKSLYFILIMLFLRFYCWCTRLEWIY
jgi:hypothetical protein